MASTRRSKSAKKSSTKKGKRAPSEWNKLVMSVNKEMKAANKNVQFGDAPKEAATRKKKM
jgi:uncharacterized FlaG/YvyC family protein